MCLLPSMVESSKVPFLYASSCTFKGRRASVCPCEFTVSPVSQGKDEVYDRMLLDYFLSYHQFIHLLCRVAINCEKFTDTLVKLSTSDQFLL